jgi:preprotein translocase subunit SecB
MLWPYLTQTIRQITAMMGIEPIEIKIPVNYDLKAQRKDK